MDATAPRDHSPGWWGMLWRHKGAELTKWSETYTYDSQNRLTKARMNEQCARYFAYTYDGVGNMLSKTTEDATTTDSYDAADELLSASRQERGHHHPDVTTYSYDLNGNETRAGDNRYSYNLANQLIQVEGKHGHDRVSYSYAEDGLMQTRSTHSEKTAYAWDRSFDTPELAIETDSKGEGRFQMKDSRSYTYGQGPIGIVHGRGTVSFHTDALGSVIELSDDHGKVVDSYRYTPFGGSYGPGASNEAPGETSENPIRFAGQYLDSESDLYAMRAREYDPETGRFLETDPITCDEGGSCGSVYVYVDDRPTVDTDPSGMCPIANGTPSCTARSSKRFNVTFFNSGSFHGIRPKGNGIWEAADNILANNKGKPCGWRICSQGQLFEGRPWEKGKWGYEGHYGGSAGPNWVYDDTGPDRPADLESKAIAWCYLGATFTSWGHGNWRGGKGYVYMAPPWVKHNSEKVPVTRYYAEFYGDGKNDPSIYFSYWPSWAAPVVNVSEYVGSPDVAESYVHRVCSDPKLKSGGWMGIWANHNGIDSNRYKAIKQALDRCSAGT
jgi:RHS repeat-associated protein